MGMARAAWSGWKRLAHDIGNFQSRFLLTVFYFTVLVPFALVVRVTGDPLRLRRRPRDTAWAAWARREPDIEGARRQF